MYFGFCEEDLSPGVTPGCHMDVFRKECRAALTSWLSGSFVSHAADNQSCSCQILICKQDSFHSLLLFCKANCDKCLKVCELLLLVGALAMFLNEEKGAKHRKMFISTTVHVSDATHLFVSCLHDGPSTQKGPRTFGGKSRRTRTSVSRVKTAID